MTTNLIIDLVHERAVGLAHGLLMITQDGHCAIRRVVRGKFLEKRAVLRRAQVELLLKRGRGVVRTEHLGCEAFHVRGEVLVNGRGGDAVEDGITLALPVPLEDPDVLKDLRRDGDDVVVPDRVFAEEVENKLALRLQSDVFVPQRAAADSIRFFVTLLVTCTQS